MVEAGVGYPLDEGVGVGEGLMLVFGVGPFLTELVYLSGSEIFGVAAVQFAFRGADAVGMAGNPVIFGVPPGFGWIGGVRIVACWDSLGHWVGCFGFWVLFRVLGGRPAFGKAAQNFLVGMVDRYYGRVLSPEVSRGKCQ